MKKLLVFLAVLVLALPVLAQVVGAPIEIKIPGLDLGLVDAVLGFFGIGLVYVVNWLKKKIGWEGKKAVLLVIGSAILASAATLIVKGQFSLKWWLIYALAVVGEMTAWFKFTPAGKKESEAANPY